MTNVVATPMPAVERAGQLDTLFSAPWFTDYELRDALREKRLATERPRGVRRRVALWLVVATVAVSPLAALAGATAAVLVTLVG